MLKMVFVITLKVLQLSLTRATVWDYLYWMREANGGARAIISHFWVTQPLFEQGARLLCLEALVKWCIKAFLVSN